MFRRIRNIVVALIILYLIGWYFQWEYVEVINMQVAEWWRSRQ